MKKILVLANHYNTLRVFRRELLLSICKNNKVLVIIPNCDDENRTILESYGCQVKFVELERRGMNPLHDIKLYFSYRKILNVFQPDVVITYTIKCNIYGAYACKHKNTPCYVNITGLGSAFQNHGIARNVVRFMYKHSLNKVQKVFFENCGNRDTFVSEGIIKQEQAVAMKGAGVNTEVFSYQQYPSEVYGLRFLYVGRIMKEKGVDELFETIEIICNKYPGTIFDFIGWHEDDYKKTVESLQNKGYIRFHGWQQDVVPFYRQCHCIIHPSWHEGMSNTLLEGASCGRALITSDVHGCMEAVDDGKNGFLFRVKNRDSLLDAVEKIICLSTEERIQMGKCGREKMKAEFEKKDVVEKTLTEMNLMEG